MAVYLYYALPFTVKKELHKYIVVQCLTIQVSIERLDDPYTNCMDSSEATSGHNMYNNIENIPVDYTVKV